MSIDWQGVVNGLAGGALAGGAALLVAYLREKGRNQAAKEDIATITAEVERVKREHAALLAQTTLVNAKQYEIELEAYREVWSTLLPVHKAVLALRPIFDYVKEGETPDERQKARLKAFGDTFNPFSHKVWEHKPFYPADVYSELNELLRLMHSEAVDYQHGDPHQHREYWREAQANSKAIATQTDKVCEAIRNRLSIARVA